MFLKTYTGDVSDLCLTFTVANDDFGVNEEPLIPNGANIEVTNENKRRYICERSAEPFHYDVTPRLSLTSLFHRAVTRSRCKTPRMRSHQRTVRCFYKRGKFILTDGGIHMVSLITRPSS